MLFSRGENGGSGRKDWMKKHSWWIKWAFPVLGLASLIWFLVRVVPKPNRATYPCQRVAAPLAGGFIAWIVGMVASVFAFRRGKQLFAHSRLGKAAVCFAIAAVAAFIAIEWMPEEATWATPATPENSPIGVARGVQPGRVTWVRDANVTSWAFPGCDQGGFTSTWNGETGIAPYGYWYESDNIDQTVVDQMVSDSVEGLAGESTEADAWDAMIRHFNIERGDGDVGYQAGEKFMIKINLTTAAWTGGAVNGSGTQTANKGWVNTSPQIILSVLRQLVNVVGVAQSDITVGDTTAYFPNHYWNILHGEFPNVKYLDARGTLGRELATWSAVEIDWSTPDAVGKNQDHVELHYAEASYIINIPALKGHYCGITVSGKNNFGSFIRLPNPQYGGPTGYYNLHNGMPGAYSSDPAWKFTPGVNKYRTLVDIMGHSDMGGKTLLHLVDGIYGGYLWTGNPYRWHDVFGGDWPCSIFASMDAVAIDSVSYDFLLTEWPHVVGAAHLQGGAEDYLHEAALAHNPGSGTVYDPEGTGGLTESLGVHEHWNNETDKQYTRNLETGDGIELYIPGTEPPTHELTTSVVGNAGGTIAPASGPQLDGTVVNLVADPCEGWQVKQWGGDAVTQPGAGLTNNTVVMDAAKSVTVEFAQFPWCWTYVTQCHGDADGTGAVDTVDWPTFRDAFGSVYPAGNYHPCADMDRDGDVDTVDWPQFRDYFGQPAPADCAVGGTWPPL